MTKTLFGKIFLMSLVIILVLSLITGLSADFFLKRYILHSKEEEMTKEGKRVVSALSRYLQNIDSDLSDVDNNTNRNNGMMGNGMMGQGMMGRNRNKRMGKGMGMMMWMRDVHGMIDELERVLGARIWLVGKDGLIYAEANPVKELKRDELQSLLNGEKVTKVNWNDESDQSILAVALPINVENKVIGGLFIVTPMRQIHLIQGQLRKIIIISALLGVLIAVILTVVFSRHLTRPLQAMERVIGKMRKGDFSGQLKIDREDELGQLAGHFNHLNRELDETIEMLTTEREQTQRIINSMSEGVISLNHEGEVMVSNPAANKLLPIADNGTLQTGEIISQLPGLHEQLNQVKVENSPRVEEIEYNNQVLLSTVSPLCCNDEKEIAGWVIVLQDVTNKWRLLQLQKELIANVSHEFKTPLTSIKGFAELMLENKIESQKDLKNSLQVINHEAERLIRMVNDLLKMARQESLKLNKVDLDLELLVEDVVESMKPKLEKAEVEVDLKSHLDNLIKLDSDRIKQVFYNLLDNAIRFSPRESTIQITMEETEEGIEIEVRDEGPGIPENQLEMIFDRFYKVDKARSAGQIGTGLGLSIVKGIIEEHNGQIRAYNQQTGGAVFEIKLPIK